MRGAYRSEGEAVFAGDGLVMIDSGLGDFLPGELAAPLTVASVRAPRQALVREARGHAVRAGVLRVLDAQHGG